MGRRLVAIEEPYTANPAGEGIGSFATGMLFGGTILGAAWAVVAYFTSKTAAAAPAAPVAPGAPATCPIPPVSLKGVGVPPGVTQVVSNPYKTYTINTYYISPTWGWGANVIYKDGQGDQVWSKPDAASALALLQSYVDGSITAGTP